MRVPFWFAGRCSNRKGAQEPLRLSIWALPCERAAPNSQGRGPKYSGFCHSGGRSARVVALLPRCRWRPQDPRGLLAHPFLGAYAPHVAPRARLPLFRFQPPLPCPRAAAMMCGGVAGLLPCCCRPLVNVAAPPCSVPYVCCGVASEGHWCSPTVPCWRFASATGHWAFSCRLLPAGSSPSMLGALQAPGRLPLWATCCLLRLICS